MAHATAEEETVYPTLRRKAADITEHEAEHGEEEHAEIIEALLAFLRAKGTDTEKYDDALEDLATVVNHHSNEEEQTIINPAREEVALEAREQLAVAWLTRRNQLLEEGCASEEQVAALLEEAVAEGTLAPEEAREEAEDITAAAKEKARGRGRRQARPLSGGAGPGRRLARLARVSERVRPGRLPRFLRPGDPRAPRRRRARGGPPRRGGRRGPAQPGQGRHVHPRRAGRLRRARRHGGPGSRARSASRPSPTACSSTSAATSGPTSSSRGCAAAPTSPTSCRWP